MARHVIVCTTSGTSVPSMPDITLRKDGDAIFKFDDKEYFLFTPTKKTTI